MTKTSMMTVGMVVIVCLVALALFRQVAPDAAMDHIPQDDSNASERHVVGKMGPADVPPHALTATQSGRRALDGESPGSPICICDSMFNSYSNCEASVLADWTNRIQSVAESLPDDLFNETFGAFVVAVYHDLDLYASGTRKIEFYDVRSLGAFLDTMLVLPHLVHDATRGRAYLSDIHVACEGLVYKVLTNCKDICVQKGSPDLMDVVEDALSRWIAFMESNSGYTRQFVWQDLARARVNGFRTIGDMTWDEFVSYRVEQSASFLVHCGYRPQWMAEAKKVSSPDWVRR